MSIRTIVKETIDIYEMDDEQDRLAIRDMQILIKKMPASSLSKLQAYLNSIIASEIARKKQC